MPLVVRNGQEHCGILKMCQVMTATTLQCISASQKSPGDLNDISLKRN